MTALERQAVESLSAAAARQRAAAALRRGFVAAFLRDRLAHPEMALTDRQRCVLAKLVVENGAAVGDGELVAWGRTELERVAAAPAPTQRGLPLFKRDAAGAA